MKFCTGGGAARSRRSAFRVQHADGNHALDDPTVRQFISTELHPLFARTTTKTGPSTRPATQLARQTDAMGTIEIKPSTPRGLLSMHGAPPTRRPAPL